MAEGGGNRKMVQIRHGSKPRNTWGRVIGRSFRHCERGSRNNTYEAPVHQRGLPRAVDWRGGTVQTSIFKSPQLGRVRVTRLNVEGEQQSDLSLHGGIDTAVYAYPSEHYTFWREELPGVDL